MVEGENEPIGIILCSEKDEAVAHYALGGITNKIFASLYRLQLPDAEILVREMETARKQLEAKKIVSSKGREEKRDRRKKKE